MTPVVPGDRIAVTGATGFVGKTLVEHLVRFGYKVVAISQPERPHVKIANLIDSYFSIDLARAWPNIGDIKGVVHLAGLSRVGPSFDYPQLYIDTNSAIVTNLFEDLLRRDWGGRAIVVSSGALYSGNVDTQSGFTENSPVSATSPYAVSKLLVEHQTDYYRRRGINALIARPFNHIGPGQDCGFIVPDLVEKIRVSAPGEAIAVGNLDSSRDYTDVRDVVEAYRHLLEAPDPQHRIYNICSGRARSGREILNAVCNALGKPVPPVLHHESRAFDPSTTMMGSASRIQNEMGWSTTLPLESSIADFIADHL